MDRLLVNAFILGAAVYVACVLFKLGTKDLKTARKIRRQVKRRKHGKA